MPPEDVCGISRNFSRLSPCEAAGCIRVTHPCAGRRQKCCHSLAAPRLACVKPVASVHPEPGSNSPLFILFFYFSLSFRQPDQQPRIVPASALFFLLDGGLPPSSFCLVSLSHHFNVLCAVSFSESGYKGTAFIFNRQIFSRTFFQVSFSEPRVRAGPTPSGITPKLHDHRSVSLLRLQRYCLLPFPPNFSASFFAPFFNIFHNRQFINEL